MANGDYWNRGGRQEGMRTNTAMDTLERIIGMGSGIAQGVQANRDKREAYNLNYIESLTKGIGSNFQNDGIGGVNQIIEKLESYKSNRMETASPETLELLDMAKMRVLSQREENSDFLVNKQIMMGKQKNYQDFVSDIFMYDAPNATSEQKIKIREKLGSEYVDDEASWKIAQETKMRDMMVDYSNDFSNWYTRHGDRLTDGMVSNFGASQQYMLEALNAWKDDGKIDKTEYDFFYGGLVSGDSKQLEQFVGTRYLGEKNAINVGYENLNTEKKNFGIIDSAIKDKEMLYGDLLKALPQDYITQVSKDFMKIGEKLDDNTKINLTEDQVAYLIDESAKNSYEKIEQINSNLMGLKQKDQIERDSVFDLYRSGYPEEITSEENKNFETNKEKYISNLKSEHGSDWEGQYDSREWGELGGDKYKKGMKPVSIGDGYFLGEGGNETNPFDDLSNVYIKQIKDDGSEEFLSLEKITDLGEDSKEQYSKEAVGRHSHILKNREKIEKINKDIQNTKGYIATEKISFKNKKNMEFKIKRKEKEIGDLKDNINKEKEKLKNSGYHLNNSWELKHKRIDKNMALIDEHVKDKAQSNRKEIEKAYDIAYEKQHEEPKPEEFFNFLPYEYRDIRPHRRKEKEFTGRVQVRE